LSTECATYIAHNLQKCVFLMLQNLSHYWWCYLLPGSM